MMAFAKVCKVNMGITRLALGIGSLLFFGNLDLWTAMRD